MIAHNALKWRCLFPNDRRSPCANIPPSDLFPRWRIKNVTWAALLIAWRLPWVAQDPILRAPWRMTQKLYGICPNANRSISK